jgi:thiamine-monophosphate kinase
MSQSVNEKELLAKVLQAFPATGQTALGLPLDDDTAVVLPRSGRETILTCDWFLEGTHFVRGKHAADSVGWKCLARAVSDIAAMGGSPTYFLLSLAIPERLGTKWLREFLQGLRRAAKAFDCKLAGGDTTRSNDILVSVTVVGEIKKALAIRRSGAQPGDKLFVSGTLGEAELGLKMLRRERGLARPKNVALRKHLYPEPRLVVGEWLAKKRLASAMMDLSDGLSSDLLRLCEASGVGATIAAEQLPTSRLARRKEALSLALHGGDDYELLFAVRPEKARKIPREYGGISLSPIGEITPTKSILVENAGKTTLLAAGGWDPFRK